jgi:hypothetical protein
MPICLVLSRKAPQGSGPAFASSDVVGATELNRELLHYGAAFAFSLTAVRTAIGPSCDVLSPVTGEQYGFILFRWNDTIG